MAKINFGGVEETVVTREEFPLEKAKEVIIEADSTLKNNVSEKIEKLEE